MHPSSLNFRGLRGAIDLKSSSHQQTNILLAKQQLLAGVNLGRTSASGRFLPVATGRDRQKAAYHQLANSYSVSIIALVKGVEFHVNLSHVNLEYPSSPAYH